MITHLGEINLGDTRAIQGATLRVGYDFATHDKPLTITGVLTLSEYTGDTSTPTTAPAVRRADDSINNPAPVQTAVSDDVDALLPHRQPMQHLQEALIAQHKAQRMIRQMQDVKDGDGKNRIAAINDAITTVNNYFASDDWYGGSVPKIGEYLHGDSNDVLGQMDSQHVFYLQLARQAVVRGIN